MGLTLIKTLDRERGWFSEALARRRTASVLLLQHTNAPGKVLYEKGNDPRHN